MKKIFLLMFLGTTLLFAVAENGLNKIVSNSSGSVQEVSIHKNFDLIYVNSSRKVTLEGYLKVDREISSIFFTSYQPAVPLTQIKINDKIIAKNVTDYTISLPVGFHKIEITLDNTNGGLHNYPQFGLSWAIDELKIRAKIPNSNFYTKLPTIKPTVSGGAGKGNGLLGAYYYGSVVNPNSRKAVRVDPLVDFSWNWNTLPSELTKACALAGWCNATNQTVTLMTSMNIIWSGYIELPTDGKYTITMKTSRPSNEAYLWNRFYNTRSLVTTNGLTLSNNGYINTTVSNEFRVDRDRVLSHDLDVSATADIIQYNNAYFMPIYIYFIGYGTPSENDISLQWSSPDIIGFETIPPKYLYHTLADIEVDIEPISDLFTVENKDKSDVKDGVSSSGIITTKVANQPFTLNVISKRPASVQDETIYAGVFFDDSESLVHVGDFHSKNNSVELTLTINKAVRDGKIIVRYCGDPRVDWKECWDSNGSIKTSENNTSQSDESDNFAIRPAKFTLTIPSETRAGDEFSIIAKALDATQNSTTNYSEKIELFIEQEKSTCIHASSLLPSAISFIDGSYTSTEAIFNEVGNLRVILTEDGIDEFAKVDRKDTKDEARLIEQIEVEVSSYPYQIRVENAPMPSFAYYSNATPNPYNTDALVYDLKFTALNKSGEVTKNYDPICFDTQNSSSLKFNLSSILPTTMNYSLSEVSNKEDWSEHTDATSSYYSKSVSMPVSKIDFETIFNHGVANQKVALNFNRSSNTLLNPITLSPTLSLGEIADVSKNQDTLPDDSNNLPESGKSFTTLVGTLGSVDMLYGRIYTPDASIFESSYEPTITHEYYSSNGCLKTDHTSSIKDWCINSRENDKHYISLVATIYGSLVDFNSASHPFGGALSGAIKITNNSNISHEIVLLRVPEYLFYDKYSVDVAGVDDTQLKDFSFVIDFHKSEQVWGGAGAANEEHNDKVGNTTIKTDDFERIRRVRRVEY